MNKDIRKTVFNILLMYSKSINPFI